MVKKILAIMPKSIGGRLTTSSIIDGFCQNDCEVTVYDELKDEGRNDFLNDSYDFIFGYDYSAVMLKKKYNLSFPTANYFSDEIRKPTSGSYWKDYVEELYMSDNYTFYWDKALSEKESSGIKNIFYLPHFVNVDVYKDLAVKPEFDVMFAGRLDTDYRLDFFEELVSNLPDLEFCWFSIEKHYEDAMQRSKNPFLLKKCYKGFIDNEQDMAKAINNTKIVFNMNSQGISSLNYRTFQTTACNRLLISDLRDELNLFGGKLPVYTDIKDLVQKIRRYLTDTDLYNYTCETCREITVEQHNSKDGAFFILECMQKY